MKSDDSEYDTFIVHLNVYFLNYNFYYNSIISILFDITVSSIPLQVFCRIKLKIKLSFAPQFFHHYFFLDFTKIK